MFFSRFQLVLHELIERSDGLEFGFLGWMDVRSGVDHGMQLDCDSLELSLTGSFCGSLWGWLNWRRH